MNININISINTNILRYQKKPPECWMLRGMDLRLIFLVGGCMVSKARVVVSLQGTTGTRPPFESRKPARNSFNITPAIVWPYDK